MASACTWAHSPFYAVVTAAPCLGFIGFLCSKAQAALERLHLAGSSLLWAAFWACFALPTVALARLLLEFTSSSLTAWNALALVHTFALGATQVAIVCLLLHGFLGVTYKAAQRTLVTAVTVAGGDAALRVLLLSLGIPLYYIRMCSSLPPLPAAPPPPPPAAPPPSSPALTPSLPPPAAGDAPPSPATLLSHVTAAALQALLQHQPSDLHDDNPFAHHGALLLTSPTDTHHAAIRGSALPGSAVAAAAAALSSPHAAPGGLAHGTSSVRRALGRLLVDLVRAWQTVADDGAPGGANGAARPMAGGPQCLRHRWSAWSLHLTLCVLLAATYALLLLLPFTPLRDGLSPGKRALTRYLVALAGCYAAASLGALLAGCGVAGGACVWALPQWLLQVGLAPLLWATFLAGPLGGAGGMHEGLDEDLLMFSEMRDAGVLDDDDAGVGGASYFPV